MRKSRLFMILMAVMVAGMMTIAFAGCDQQEEQTEEETTTTVSEVSEETTVALAGGIDESFNLAEALKDTGVIATLDAPGVDYYIEQDSNVCETVYISACQDEEELDGMVGFIMAYDESDKSYEDLPDYRVAGEKDGITYVVSLATDLRYNAEDPQQTSDYEKMTEAMKSIEIK